MSTPFDPTLKTLAELSPGDWLPLVRRRRRRMTIEDTDVGMVVSGASDKLFRVHDNPEYLLHLDFESGHFREELPARLRMYNSVFGYRHNRYVLSVVVLLKPEADSPQWTGTLVQTLPGFPQDHCFPYEVIYVWKLDPQQLLSGGIGTLALAPISNVHPGEVRGIIREMKTRLSTTSARRSRDVLAAAYVLMGLRYSEAFAQALFEEVLGMEESTTYQGIIRRGRVEEARQILLQLGEQKFHTLPSATGQERLESIEDVSELEGLLLRLRDADSWEELLPARSRTGRRRRSS